MEICHLKVRLKCLNSEVDAKYKCKLHGHFKGPHYF